MKLSYHHLFRAGSDPESPPLLLLHGTGGDEESLMPLAHDLSPGSAVLSPRGDVLENGLPRFFRRFAEGVFDLADVEKRAHGLADFIAAAAGAYGFDPHRLLAVGYSNGANIASAALQLRPEALAGAVLLRPMIVLEPESGPDLSRKRILISSGDRDPLVPLDHPSQLAASFRAAGAEVTLKIHPAGHALTGTDRLATTQFLMARSKA